MRLRSNALMLALASALAVLVAACSSSSGRDVAHSQDGEQSAPASSGRAAATCSGPPVKVMAMGAFDPNGATYEPAHLVGPQAAAKAINTTCELGRPMQIVSCNDHATTQGALACGQRAVSEKVLAVTGHTQSDAYVPVIAAHGIPAVMDEANGAQELSYERSYPLITGPSLVVASTTLAADLGASKVQLLTYGGPQVEFFDNIIKPAAASVGLTKLPNLVAALSTTDMTAYAAQALSSGTNSVILGTTSEQIVGFVKALGAQGGARDKIKLVGGTSFSTTVIDQLGANAEGTYLANEVADPSDTSNPGVRQMLSELRANGTEINGLNVTQFTVSAWTATHIIADVMKGSATFTPDELDKRLKSLPPDFYKAYPALPPFDFSKNALPDNPVLGQSRIFSNQMAVYKIQDGKIIRVGSDYVRVDQKTSLE